jgi:hypothetical protein
MQPPVKNQLYNLVQQAILEQTAAHSHVTELLITLHLYAPRMAIVHLTIPVPARQITMVVIVSNGTVVLYHTAAVTYALRMEYVHHLTAVHATMVTMILHALHGTVMVYLKILLMHVAKTALVLHQINAHAK